MTDKEKKLHKNELSRKCYRINEKYREEQLKRCNHNNRENRKRFWPDTIALEDIKLSTGIPFKNVIIPDMYSLDVHAPIHMRKYRKYGKDMKIYKLYNTDNIFIGYLNYIPENIKLI